MESGIVNAPPSERPPALPPRQQLAVEEVREHLLGEERVPLGMADDELTRLRVERGAERPVDQLARLVVAERFQGQRLAGRQPRTPRSCRPENQHRPGRVREHPCEELDQRLAGPVQILEHHDGRAARPNVRREAHPSVLKREHGRTRLEVAGDVEPQGQPEDLVARDLLERGILFPQPQLLSEHLREWAVRDAAAVREAAAEPEDRPGGQAFPQLPHECRLAEPGLADHQGEVRLVGHGYLL